jgi:hypothetical protein
MKACHRLSIEQSLIETGIKLASYAMMIAVLSHSDDVMISFMD